MIHPMARVEIIILSPESYRKMHEYTRHEDKDNPLGMPVNLLAYFTGLDFKDTIPELRRRIPVEGRVLFNAVLFPPLYTVEAQLLGGPLVLYVTDQQHLEA